MVPSTTRCLSVKYLGVIINYYRGNGAITQCLDYDNAKGFFANKWSAKFAQKYTKIHYTFFRPLKTLFLLLLSYISFLLQRSIFHLCIFFLYTVVDHWVNLITHKALLLAQTNAKTIVVNFHLQLARNE